MGEVHVLAVAVRRPTMPKSLLFPREYVFIEHHRWWWYVAVAAVVAVTVLWTSPTH